MLPIRNILFPTDFSEPAKAGFRLACSLARDYDAILNIVHVIPPLLVYGEGLVASPPSDQREDILHQLEHLQPGDTRIRVTRQVVEGDPATEIQRVAHALGCDLIVLGTHGRTGLGRLLMGSVAEEVVRHADCPVLTVRAPATVLQKTEEQVMVSV